MELKNKKDINRGRLFFGAAGLTNDDVTFEFEDIFLRIPKVTPTAHIESKLLNLITSDKKAKAYVLDRKINSIAIPAASHSECHNSILSNLEVEDGQSMYCTI